MVFYCSSVPPYNTVQENVEAVRFYCSSFSRRVKYFAVPFDEHDHIDLIRLVFNVTAVEVYLWSLPSRPRLAQDPDGRCASPGAHGHHLDSYVRRCGTVGRYTCAKASAYSLAAPIIAKVHVTMKDVWKEYETARMGMVLEEARQPRCACSRLVLRSVDRVGLASGRSQRRLATGGIPSKLFLEVLRVSRAFRCESDH